MHCLDYPILHSLMSLPFECKVSYCVFRLKDGVMLAALLFLPAQCFAVGLFLTVLASNEISHTCIYLP